MANNRLYIFCDRCNEGIMIAKDYGGYGFCRTKDEVNHFFEKHQMCKNSWKLGEETVDEESSTTFQVPLDVEDCPPMKPWGGTIERNLDAAKGKFKSWKAWYILGKIVGRNEANRQFKEDEQCRNTIRRR